MKTHPMITVARRAAFCVFLLSIPVLGTAQVKDSEAIMSTLQEVRSHAALAQDDAATLEAYARSPMSWESHARQLNLIKEHANDLLSDFNKLTSLRAEGSPWQQQAIDGIDPLLRDMAAHLTSTIQHLNDNKSQIQMKAYKDLVRANLDLMTRAHESISDFVDYGTAKAKADDLEQKLALPDLSAPGL